MTFSKLDQNVVIKEDIKRSEINHDKNNEIEAYGGI
jgi:hypothetical protein